MKGVVYMTGGQFKLALKVLNWDIGRAVNMLGQDQRRIKAWLDDSHNIPRWVPLFLTALTVPAARDLVLQADQHMQADQTAQIRAMETRRAC